MLGAEITTVLIYLHSWTNRFLSSFTMNEAGFLPTIPLFHFFAFIHVFWAQTHFRQGALPAVQMSAATMSHSLSRSPRLCKAQPPTVFPRRALSSSLSHTATFSRLLLWNNHLSHRHREKLPTQVLLVAVT